MAIKFGPSGIGPTKEAIKKLQLYKSLNLQACEIAFTYGIYIKENDTKEIKNEAEKLGITLSIHAPYYINLNSKEKEKIEASKKRILNCAKIGHQLGAKTITFHAGFYAGIQAEQTYQNIKNQIIELQEEIKINKWDIKLCPEIMGKKNVFGSIDEISKLAKETKCSFTIDFAHILSRYNQHKFKEVIESFPQKNWLCHFSGIEYSVEKGERKHKKTLSTEWQNLLRNLKNLDKNITIISESPDPIEDATEALEIYNKM
jgi:deoxyribonuclease IV